VTDILIRDVPEDVLAAIDANAQRVGLSRPEYLRRVLARERSAATVDVTVADFAVLADLLSDLGDPDVMSSAWQ
jgi:hypothetical protein